MNLKSSNGADFWRPFLAFRRPGHNAPWASGIKEMISSSREGAPRDVPRRRHLGLPGRRTEEGPMQYLRLVAVAAAAWAAWGCGGGGGSGGGGGGPGGGPAAEAPDPGANDPDAAALF